MPISYIDVAKQIADKYIKAKEIQHGNVKKLTQEESEVICDDCIDNKSEALGDIEILVPEYVNGYIAQLLKVNK